LADHIKAVFAWIGENRPQLLGQFNPPATDAEIDALQSVIEHPLPADLIALYKTHNGQSDENLANMVALFGVFTLMPIAAIVGSKQETDPMIGTDFDEPEWWSRGWLPITENGGGDHHCYDVAGEFHQPAGQIIQFRHDEAPRRVVAPSLDAFFEKIHQRMKAGDWP